MGRQGFTLVEMVIALALTAVLVSGIFYAFGQGMRRWARIVRESELLQIENIVGERIIRDLRAGLKGVSYDLTNGKVRMKKDGVAAYLTNAGEINHLTIAFPEHDLAKLELNDFGAFISIRN